jgi:hypothetical protein
MTMPIAFSCSCSKAMKARDEFAGRNVKCPQCGKVVTIPQAQPTTKDLPTTAALHSWVDQSLVQRPTPWLAGDETRFQQGIKAPREGTSVLAKGSLGLLILAGVGAAGWFLLMNR